MPEKASISRCPIQEDEEEGKHKEYRDACHFHPSEMAERRVRLVIGMKRYFHGKRLEGLLSVKVRALLTL